MKTPGSLASGSIAEHFRSLRDPRVDRTKLHELLDIITIALLAVISRADSWEEIEAFAQVREPWLRTFLPRRNGIPSDDTFRRVCSTLDPKEFARCFSAWSQSLVGTLAGKVVAIDGKTLRNSYDEASQRASLHLVHAWVGENSALLGQVATNAKSNESTAIPELLKLLALQGAIVTIDAMGCQKEIASQIVGKQAEYVLALKGNHPTAHQEVQQFFDTVIGTDPVQVHTSIDKGHGRLELRRVYVSSDIAWFEDRDAWKGLKSFVRVESERTLNGKTTREQRHFLTTLPSAQTELIAHAIRQHWSVENGLHWSLDVTFREDRSRIRVGHAAENFSLLRKMALMLCRRTPGKGTGPLKRWRASLDPDYLLSILTAGALKI